MTSFGALENLSTKILSLCPYSYKCIQIQRTQPYVAPYSALDTRFRDIYIYADIDIYILTHFSSHTRQLDPHTHTHTHPHITPKHTRQSPHTSHTSHISSYPTYHITHKTYREFIAQRIPPVPTAIHPSAIMWPLFHRTTITLHRMVRRPPPKADSSELSVKQNLLFYLLVTQPKSTSSRFRTHSLTSLMLDHGKPAFSSTLPVRSW